MTRSKSFEFRRRGKILFAQKWWPKAYPRAMVIFVHSWAEHSGRYAVIADHLAQHGYASYSFDFEGHGQTEGRRGSIPSFQQWVSDVDAFVLSIQSELRNVPIFLCGFGMGGCAVAHYLSAEHHQVEGAIFSASAIVVSKNLPQFRVLMAWLLGGLLPNWPISRLPPNKMSSVADEQWEYDNDPSVYHGHMNAGTGKELILANRSAAKKLAQIDTPLLVLHGEADTLVAPEGGVALYHQAQTADKTLHLYPDSFHDVFHERHKADVFEHVRIWLDVHTTVNE